MYSNVIYYSQGMIIFIF